MQGLDAKDFPHLIHVKVLRHRRADDKGIIIVVLYKTGADIEPVEHICIVPDAELKEWIDCVDNEREDQAEHQQHGKETQKPFF